MALRGDNFPCGEMKVRVTVCRAYRALNLCAFGSAGSKGRAVMTLSRRMWSIRSTCLVPCAADEATFWTVPRLLRLPDFFCIPSKPETCGNPEVECTLRLTPRLWRVRFVQGPTSCSCCVGKGMVLEDSVWESAWETAQTR